MEEQLAREELQFKRDNTADARRKSPFVGIIQGSEADTSAEGGRSARGGSPRPGGLDTGLSVQSAPYWGV